MAKGTNRAGSHAGQTGLTTNGLEGWLWDAACSIRGAVDAPKFKDYILPLIFAKRLSDVFEDEVKRLAEKYGDRETALELIQDQHKLVRFYIPPEASWSNVRKLTSNIGQRLTEILRAVAKANPSLQGVIDIVDFNATVSGQRIVEDPRLATLIEILTRYRLGLNDVEPDVLGRAYEYLLRKFAEGQGQSAGEFFTPKEVGWLIARLLRPAEGMTVYDPACGSAGLLIKAQLVVAESGKKVKKPLGLYGQELNHVTYAIAKMNMIIHDMEGEIAIGDTLRFPRFLNGPKLKTFDLVSANPMWNQDGYDESFYDSDNFDRFAFGHAPASSADWAWVQHMLASLAPTGRAVVVLDTGAAARGSGGGEGSSRERHIRRQLIEADIIEAVVLLPENLFYNTTAQGILLCLNKRKSDNRAGKVILINASREFEKGRPKNFIPEDGVMKIAAAFHTGGDVSGLVKVVAREDLAQNDFNLLPSRYIGTNGTVDEVPLEDALIRLWQAEEERRAADDEFLRALKTLGLEGGPRG